MRFSLFTTPIMYTDPPAWGGWSIVTFTIRETLSSMLQRKFG